MAIKNKTTLTHHERTISGYFMAFNISQAITMISLLSSTFSIISCATIQTNWFRIGMPLILLWKYSSSSGAKKERSIMRAQSNDGYIYAPTMTAPTT